MKRLVVTMVFVAMLFSVVCIATPIGYYGFESGSQGWSFGGSDANRDSTRSNKQDSGAAGGSWSAHVQDDSSTSHFEQSFDFSGYDSVNITFDYYPESIDSGEYVQLFCDSTEIWRFTNGDHGQSSWYTTTVEITPSDCTLDSSVQIQWEGDPGLSGNIDDMWVDGIDLEGIIAQQPPTTPTSITCDGGNCNNTFYSDVELICSGSTDPDGDTITYSIEAYHGQQGVGSIAHDATTTNQGSGDRSFSHTIGGGNNRLLVVGVTFEDSLADKVVNSVTYNGVTMTQVDWARAGTGYSQYTAFYYLLESDLPSSGSYTVNVDVSATPTRNVMVGVSSYENVNQALDDSCTSNTGQPISCSITTIEDNSWVMSVVGNGGGGDYTYSAGNERYELDGSASSSTGAGGDDIDTSAGSFSVSWSHSGNVRQALVAAAFSPANTTVYAWNYIGNHTNGSSFVWNFTGINPLPQTDVDLRCRAKDISGTDTYSSYYDPAINMTLSLDAPPSLPDKPAIISWVMTKKKGDKKNQVEIVEEDPAKITFVESTMDSTQTISFG